MSAETKVADHMNMKVAIEERLTEVGGSRWKRGEIDRIYFNDLHKWYGLECSHYGTGNISAATLNGESISNSQARKILNNFNGVRVWFDVLTQKFEHKTNRIASDSEIQIVIDSIKLAAKI